MEELRHAEDLPVSDKAKLIQGLGDSYSKMVASSKRLLPEVSEMATAVKTMMMFGDYVQTKTTDKQVLDVIIDALNEFGAILKKEYKE